jgi:hypothetical protein
MWEKLKRVRVQNGRKPRTIPTISRSSKKKDVGHVSVPRELVNGSDRFDIYHDAATGDLGFKFHADGDLKVQDIKTNPTMVRLGLPRQMLVGVPQGTKQIALEVDKDGLVVVRAAQLADAPDAEDEDAE